MQGFDNFQLDADKKLLWHDGELVALPPKAIELLAALMEKPGEVVTKNELLERVWGETFVEESVLSNNIYLLRKTLTELGAEKNLIQTVPRRGYRFVNAVAAENAELVLEHHVFEQTTVEIETATENETGGAFVSSLPAAPKSSFRQPKILAAALVLLACVALSATVAIWQFASATAESADLNRIRSIAVLPLKPITANGEDAERVLSLGLADALISNLGSSPALVVRPVSAITKYADDKEQDALEIGRELRADAVLEGTFQRRGDRLLVRVRLLNVADGKQIWSGTFDETERDVFDLQDRISREAATALMTNFNQSRRELVLKRYTDSVAAYQAYQRGRYLYFHRDEAKENLNKSFAEFETAIRLDAEYALAYAGLADAYARQANNTNDAVVRRESYERAKDLAKKAIRLDPNLAEPYASLGWINRIYDWNWAESEANFRRAIELAPNNWEHHRLYAYLLVTLGRVKEALAANSRAKQLNPLQDDSFIFYCARRYEEAAAEAVKRMQVSESTDPPQNLAMSLVEMGRAAEAVKILEQIAPTKPDGFKLRFALAIAYSRAGEREKAENLLAELKAQTAESVGQNVRLASVYAALNRPDEAFAALEKAVETRDDRLMWSKTNPHFDKLRGEPRFQEILRKMNLE